VIKQLHDPLTLTEFLSSSVNEGYACMQRFSEALSEHENAHNDVLFSSVSYA
jgi:hypothetical protein